MARSRPRCDIDGDGEKARLTEICHALPEVTSEGHEPHVIYTVRGRNFAYFQEDHHGDGRVALVCKAPPGENAALVATDPVRIFTPSYVGRRGWIVSGSTPARSTGLRSPSACTTATASWRPRGSRENTPTSNRRGKP